MWYNTWLRVLVIKYKYDQTYEDKTSNLGYLI